LRVEDPLWNNFMKTNTPKIAIIMGSDSDWPALQPAADACAEFGIACDVQVVSAHRTPMDMVRFASSAHTRGVRVIIAGAGGAAHLPGMVASLTPLPVIGVPVESKSLKGLDSLLSIVQMPGGVPVATMAINGGRNAGLFAVRILATSDPELLEKTTAFQTRLAAESKSKNRKLQSETQSYQHS
jgi:5-(carboxyamino)imidazole ribonucleotide mutase